MPLRCLLFCADAEATSVLTQVLADLQIDAEHCPNSITATERITSQPFQIVILDWDDQPDAGLLLNTARTRKASERPLTLAIVGDDAGVPKALQAGANSVLRKPLLVNHARDTLTTARDLLRAKLEQATQSVKIVAKSPLRQLAGSAFQGQATLRAGEFLQSSSPQPGGQFTTESDLDSSQFQAPAPAPIDPLKDLEPTAGTLDTKAEPKAEAAPAASQTRGLAWYKARSVSTGGGTAAAPALAPVAPRPAENTELLGYGDTPSNASEAVTVAIAKTHDSLSLHLESSLSVPITPREKSDQKAETELFAYMDGEQAEKPRQAPAAVRAQASSRRVLSTLAVVGAVAACAAIAYLILPQKLWKPAWQRASNRATSAVHAWLNPQPVAPPQAPPSHENFGRAGDEYKLPVAEAIPDATTDPSQIRIVPVVDPTAKHPTAGNSSGNQAIGTDPSSSVPDASGQMPDASPDGSSGPNSSATAAPGASVSQGTSQQPVSSPPIPQPAQTNSSPAPVRQSVTPTVVQKSVRPQFTAVNSAIPSSLRSQMAANTSEAGGNKSPEAAMPSIEPVALPEASARGLLLQQAAPLYPDTARGQSGTVVLQVFVGRDGTVQDAKFLQGSLVFARAAIEAVKQWRFQPYAMNGRPVSTVTSLTVSFKPGS